jgi:UDPglucose--hexose-1-phosphate uridylyltransferase
MSEDYPKPSAAASAAAHAAPTLGEGALRLDPLSGAWSILATGRAGRPADFAPPAIDTSDPATCPFCCGHEAETPPPVLELSAPGETCPWTVRVVPNRYPALTDPATAGAEPLPAPGPYEALSPFGAHEVVIETPRHGEGLGDLRPAHARLVVDAWAARLARYAADPRFAAAVIFRNEGALAGASLAHAHTQLLALPRIPSHIEREAAAFIGYAAAHDGACLLCAMRDADESAGLLVARAGGMGVTAPWASTAPAMTRVSPARCSPGFHDIDPGEADGLATLLPALARAYRLVHGSEVALNLVVHSAPFADPALTGPRPFHWHIDVVPRFSCAAGFEVGTGWGLDATGPEATARRLRDALE